MRLRPCPLLLSVALSVACGSAAPEVVEPAEPALPELPELPRLLPQGSELVVVAQPARLMSSQAIRGFVESVLPPTLLDAFARRTGIEPHEVEQVVVGEYGDGMIVIARGPWPARDVVRAAENRMNSVEASSDAPFFRRSGFLGDERWDLVALDDHVVMAAREATVATASLLARAARGHWPDDVEPTLDAADVAPLVAEHGEAAAVLYVPVPLELPPGFGTSALLARERALAATVEPEDPDVLVIEVALRGEFPESASDNFRNLVESVGSSDLGMALGIGEAARTLSVQSDTESVLLRLRISARALAMGLRVLFLADLEELLGEAGGSAK